MRILESEWLTTSEAAGYLGVKHRTVLSWVRQGKMKAYALSGTRRHIWRFRKQDLDAILLSRPVVISEMPAASAERREI